MRSTKHFLLPLLVIVIAIGQGWAQTQTQSGEDTHLTNIAEQNATQGVELDSVSPYVVSLLISESTHEHIYALFGHAALRVVDKVNNTDAVYNYGVFDMTSPTFYYDFVSGRTDQYKVAKENTTDYLIEAGYRGLSIDELTLNLSAQATRQIVDFLEWNILPENQYYLYNFAYDNCATRLYDIVLEKSGVDSIAIHAQPLTWRQGIEQHTSQHPWAEWGMSLALGRLADEQMMTRQQLFLPALMLQILSEATLYQGGKSYPLVLAKQHYPRLAPAYPAPRNAWWSHPITVLVALILIALILGLKSTRWTRIYDSVWLVGMGIAGLVLFFLAFISIHPFTYPNATLLLLHPFHFLSIASVWSKKTKQPMQLWLHLIIFVGILLYLVLSPFRWENLLLSVFVVVVYLQFTPLRNVYKKQSYSLNKRAK